MFPVAQGNKRPLKGGGGELPATEDMQGHDRGPFSGNVVKRTRALYGVLGHIIFLVESL